MIDEDVVQFILVMLVLWDDAVRHTRVIMDTKTLEAPREAPSLAPRNSGRHGGGCTCLGITAARSPDRLHSGVDMRFVQGSVLVLPELHPYGGNSRQYLC